MTNTTSISRSISVLLIGFGVLCLFTSMFVSGIGKDQLLRDSVDGNGGIIGPFTIEDGNTVVHAEVQQNVPLDNWSFVNLELLDANKNYLTGFGEEFWHEDGYDSDGYWRESDTSYDAKLTIPKAGDYYLKVAPETSLGTSERERSGINVELESRGFSAVPHFAAGIIALIAGLLLNFGSGGITYQMIKEWQ